MLSCNRPAGLRSDTSIVVETAQAFSTHHAAMLIGYGAHALCPYLAYETARQWRLSSRTQSLVKSGKVRAQTHSYHHLHAACGLSLLAARVMLAT